MAAHPQDTGKVLAGLQSSIASLKDSFRSLSTESSPHFARLQSQIEALERSLKNNTEQLLGQVMASKSTITQPLIQGRKEGKSRSPLTTAAEMQLDSSYMQRSRGKFYTAKPPLPTWKDRQEAPTINEEDISQGMFNLINRGMIPKDIDLTPAFESGAPPFATRPARYHSWQAKNDKGITQTGSAPGQSLKFDIPPEPQSSLPPVSIRPTHTSYLQIQFDKSPETPSEPKPKEYEELMDTHSAHQFVIRKGKTLEATPEFQSYHRKYGHSWSYIAQVIKELEDMLGKFSVPIAIINGARIVEVAGDPPSPAILLSCIVNQTEVQPLLDIPALRYIGEHGKNTAATVIQSLWKMHKARSAYKQLSKLIAKAKIIQYAVRRFLALKQMRKNAARNFRDKLEEWKIMQEKFKSDWPKIASNRRIEVHLNSFSVKEVRRLTMEKCSIRQNLQISRLFALQDSQVDVVYVSSVEIASDLIKLYSKVLEVGEVERADSRFHVITPEIMNRMPPHLSVTTALLYSPKAIKRIRSLIRGRTAYIVPGVMSKDEIEASLLLKIPILGGDPFKSALYSTKSGSRRIFSTANMPTGPGAYDLYDEQEFFNTLTSLALGNLDVHTWIFKIDDEFGGRGHAKLEVGRVKLLQVLRKERRNATEEEQQQLYRRLRKMVEAKARIAMPTLYPTWKNFMSEFVRSGGVIEAAPPCAAVHVKSSCVCFCVEPDGQVTFLGAYDKLSGRDCVTSAYFFPQQSLPNVNLKLVTAAIGGALYSQGLIGHAKVDIVSFPNAQESKFPLFWTVDLSLRMTDVAASSLLFNFLMEGDLDPITGAYWVEPGALRPLQGSEPRKEPRCFLYIPLFQTPGLSSVQYRTFFYMCKVNGISFNLEERRGTYFLLPDILQSGIIGLMAMGRNTSETVALATEGLQFIQNQAGVSDTRSVLLLDEARSDTISASDVTSAIAVLRKSEERKQRKRTGNKLVV